MIETTRKRETRNILVLGIGHALLSDDGFGVHLIRYLTEASGFLPPNARCFDGGTSPVDALDRLMEADDLVVVDAVDAGGEPGALYRFGPDDPEFREAGLRHGHRITVFDTLGIVRELTGRVPRTVVMAVQPRSLEWGTELSREVGECIPRVAGMVRDCVQGINNYHKRNEPYRAVSPPLPDPGASTVSESRSRRPATLRKSTE